MKKPITTPLRFINRICFRILVYCRFCLIGLFVHTASANSSFEEDIASSLLQHLGLNEISNSVIASEWSPPAMMTLESTLLSVVPQGENGKMYSIFDTNSNFVVRLCVASATSESDIKMSWALNRTAKSIDPTTYFDSFIITNVVSGVSFIYERQGRSPHFGPISEARFFCLVGKASFELSNATVNVENLALAILRAGGVEIPDEPQPEP